ncbi:hypothetical protein FRB99_009046 [Tulasnella sp. 403]|nr:hypothetical protein FRB99_009046 [Tulasnella sp. 403]
MQLLQTFSWFVVVAGSQLFPRQSNLNLDSCLSGFNFTTITSSDPTYASASLAFNRRFEYRPAAIVYPTTPQDVQNVVNCASGNGVPVVARSGGHSYAAFGLGGQDGALVVDMSKMKALSVDPSTGFAVSQTGLLLGELALGIWNQGQRALPHGTCPYVGTGGHAAYGGYGLFSRTAGLLLDTVVAADVVLANGTFVTASSTSHPDLFWALRGAAPSFGIVTSWTFATLPAPQTNLEWQLTWGTQIQPAQLVSVLMAFQSFAFSAPRNELSAVVYLAPDNTGTPQVSISGTFYGSQTEFNTAIAPLRNTLLGAPTLDIKTYNWIDGLTAVDGSLNTTQSEPPNTFFAKSILANTPFSNDSWTSWINFMVSNGKSSGLQWWVQIDLYGGLISTVPESATSYAHRDAVLNFQFYGSASLPFPDSGIAFMNNLVSSLTPNPYAAYSNYVDPTLTAEQWHSLYFGSNYQRLTVIKREVDPGRVFFFPQAIEAAQAGVTTSSSPSGKAGSPASSATGLERSLAIIHFLLTFVLIALS